jgi:predicted membrane protein
MPLKNTDEPGTQRYFSRENIWSGIKLILVVILWLGLMVLTYYTLLTLPAVLFVSIWIYLLISRRYTKHKPKELGWQNQENDEKNNKKE